MLSIHMLGHVYITQGNRTIPVSAKALALIVYLYIEKLPQHRERLADLLWNTPLSRKNLRVELARIRSTGLNIFPSSHQLLELKDATSDIETWGAQFNQNMNQEQLTAALATLRGTPLTGLEDLGSPTFQTWVDQQRWLMLQQIEHHLSRAYWRYAREHQTWATRLISERAEALGLDNPADSSAELLSGAAAQLRPAPSIRPPAAPSEPPRILPIHFERPAEESVLEQVLSRAADHPQLLALHGPPGSGKSYLSERMAQRFGWAVIRIPSLRSSRFVLASLAQALIRLGEAQSGDALEQVLLQPASVEEDAVKVAYALSRCSAAVMLLFEQAQDAPTELTTLIEFLFRASGAARRVFVLMNRTRAAHVPLTRALLHRIERTHSLELGLSRLPNLSVQRVLEAQFPFESRQRLRVQAARFLQRSDGNPLYLLSLIDQAPDSIRLDVMQLPQSLQDGYNSEIDACPDDVQQALKRLSVIYGRFDRHIASAVLWDFAAPQVEAALAQALSRRLLIEADPELAVNWLDGATEIPRAPIKTEFLFRSEGLRMTITQPLSASVRQDVRRRLMLAYADSLPGHAAYYAHRAHLLEDAVRLQQQYRAQLPVSLAQQRESLSAVAVGAALSDAAEYDAHLTGLPDPSLSRQGYSVYRSSGELGILSANRYGLPSTLTIRFALPPSAQTLSAQPLSAQTSSAQTSGTLTLRWRLDLYQGGAELGPNKLPFALRVQALNSGVAHVLVPEPTTPYREDGAEYQSAPGCSIGEWMEHRLTLTQAELSAQVLELSVRAIDVALTINALTWNNCRLLVGPPSASVAPGTLPDIREHSAFYS